MENDLILDSSHSLEWKFQLILYFSTLIASLRESNSFSCFAGILPFGSIFIEMYFIFTSFWAYKIYYVYGFMLLGEFSEKISSVLLTNLSVSVPDPADCDSLRHYRLHLLPPQRRGLQVSLDHIGTFYTLDVKRILTINQISSVVKMDEINANRLFGQNV